jgi:hypothetical protein
MEIVLYIAIIVLYIFILFYIYIQTRQVGPPPEIARTIDNMSVVDNIYYYPKTQLISNSFVPMLDIVVPTHAHHSNKFNNIIGNQDSGTIGPQIAEVVVPSDWYIQNKIPSDYTKRYWPKGTIEPDYLIQ